MRVRISLTREVRQLGNLKNSETLQKCNSSEINVNS